MNKNITKADKIILSQQNNATLAKWWCLLNRLEWPEGLPDPESIKYTCPIAYTRRMKIMDAIERTIGHKATSREWNREMGEDRFENWYAKNGWERV